MDKNMANRQCCNVGIYDYYTKQEILYVDYANTTTTGFDTESVFAYVKGAKHFRFDDEVQGNLSISFQIHPYKIYSLFANSRISNDAIIAQRDVVTIDGEKVVVLSDDYVPGTVYVKLASTHQRIIGSITNNIFSSENFESGKQYIITYLRNVTNAKVVKFNDSFNNNLFFIQMETLNKNEDGEFVPFKIIGHKVALKKELNLSFSSTGEPTEITLSFECLGDKKGECLDFVEITTDESYLYEDYSQNLWINFENGCLVTNLNLFYVENDCLFMRN